MKSGALLAFGPYVLDTATRTLTRDGEEVLLGKPHLALLILFTSRPGRVIPRDELIDTGWPGVAVTPNSLDQALTALRNTLTLPSGEKCIETRPRRGFVFLPSVTPVVHRESDEALNAELQSKRAWIEGVAALQTLNDDAIVRARAVFERVVARSPDQASAHVGLANACALQFEMTRTDAEPDTRALKVAQFHAWEACRLNRRYGEAWATLGFVLERVGRRDEALAAARRAIELEPDNWRHRLRLSSASWGEERLREARCTLRLMPGLAMAHWLAASVLVARQVLDDAERELETGLAGSHDGERSSAFSSVALHWLLGLITLARGNAKRALELFECELRQEHSGHLYARECAANTWYAIGATRWRLGDVKGADGAFRECQRRVPTHFLARAALWMEALPASPGRNIDFAIAKAIRCAASHDFQGCDAEALTIERVLREGAAGSAGWLLPVEPMLDISSRPEAWIGVFGWLRRRAV
jgi:DNA-binding winged helix-turn-helix (wHTH) protein